jgi:tetratricopeptide (TPR) repeat protein
MFIGGFIGFVSKWCAMFKLSYPAVLLFVALAFSGSAQAADPARCMKDAKANDAVENCTAAIESGKLTGWDLAAAYLYRASGFQDLDKLDEAAADLQKSMTLRNPYPDTIVEQAKLKAKLKEHATVAQALTADPKDCKVDAEAEVAVSACTSAISKGNLKGTELAEAYLFRASGNDYLGKYDEARADFNQAVTTDPNFFKAYMWRGFFDMKFHKEDLAKADFDKAVELKPDSVDPWFYRARYYFEARGDWKNVVADTETAIKLDPENQNLAAYLENAQNELKKQ